MAASIVKNITWLGEFDWIIPHQANGHIAELFGERFPETKGKVFATADRLGNLGSAASAIIFPYFVANITIPYFAPTTGNGNSFFIFAALLNLAAVFCWLGMNPRKPLDTSIPRERIRLRVILMLGTIGILFLLLMVYKTFYLK